MKISKKDRNLLIGFAGILIAFLAYWFGYRQTMEQAEELENRNMQLSLEISQLEQLESHKDTYVQDTDRMETAINEWMYQFPANVLPEDDIKLFYQVDNRDLGRYVFINTMSFAQPTLLYTTNQGFAQPAFGSTSQDTIYEDPLLDESLPESQSVQPQTAANGNTEQGLSQKLYPDFYLYQSQVSIGMDCNYTGMKALVRAVYDTPYRKAIENISLAFDENTGMLSGNMIMNSYYVMGVDRTYGQPELAPVRQGTDDIFGTVEGVSSQPEKVREDSAGENAAEETEGGPVQVSDN